jgi:hypothetical protein
MYSLIIYKNKLLPITRKGRKALKTKRYQTTSSKDLDKYDERRKTFFKIRMLCHSTFPLLFPQMKTAMIKNDLLLLEHLFVNKGPEYLLRYLKNSEKAVLRVLLSPNSAPVTFDDVCVGLDFMGWPKWLRHVRSECVTRLSHNCIQYVNTLLTIRKCFTVKSRTDLSSITLPSKVPTSESFLKLATAISNKGYEQDRKFIRYPVIGQEATERLVTMTHKEYMESNPYHENESTSESTSSAYRPFDYITVSNKESEIMGTKVQSITTKTVPPLSVSKKSTPNGMGFLSIPLDRVAVIRDQDLTRRIEDFLEVYYQGETSD